MCGRAEGPRFVWKSVLGPPGDKVLHSTVVSRSWHKIAGWCATIKQARTHAVACDDRHHPLARAAAVARRRIRAAAKWNWGPGERREGLGRFLDLFFEAAETEDTSKIVAMMAWAEKEAEVAAQAAAADASKKFKQWLQEGNANGLSRQHALSKCPGQWVPGKMIKEKAVTDDSLASVVGQWEEGFGETRIGSLVATVQARGRDVEVPADMQQEVDGEARKWAGVWAEEMGMEECRWPECMDELPCIRAHHIWEAAKTFADRSGLGWDRLHPKALRRLPEAMVDELGVILMEAEEAGTWEEAVGVVVTALIPKGDGGWRPIGLMPTVVRVWARVRGGMVRDWEDANDRDFLFGGRGKGAQVAAWKFAARAESARLDNAAFAAVLLDLEKAFDKVPHCQLVKAAQEWGYPMKVLRLSLHGYRMARVIGVGGIFSRVVRPQCGLAAGSSHATRELRALLIGIFDAARRMCPTVPLTLYVDDATVESVGTNRTVAEAVVKVTAEVCKGLEGSGLVLSKTKNVVIASCKELGDDICAGLKKWMVKRCSGAKMLGVGTTAAVRRSTAVSAARVAAFARRRGQFGMLRRAGVDIARLLRTGGLAGAQFGQAALGIADYPLMQLRRRAAGLVGGAAMGKNPNMTLVCADAKLGDRADPAFVAHADVVVSWALAVWDGLLPIEVMQKSIRKAKVALVSAKRQWAVVKGPAAALVATVARLGWTVVDATLAFTDLKEEVSFTKDPLAAIKKMVFDAVRRWRWRVAGFAGEEGSGGGRCEGPVWKPIADLIGRGRWHDPGEGVKERKWDEVLTKGEQGALKSALVGGQWPQCRLFEAALADDPLCALCRWHGVEVIGSLLHRIHECPHVEARASGKRPQSFKESWANEGSDGRGRLKVGAKAWEWERGLTIGPIVVRRRTQESFIWLIEPCGLLEYVNVYIDGSLYDAFDERFAALGWAMVIVREGVVLGLARGIPPNYVKSIPAVEAWALAMAVEYVDVASARIFTDCKSVRDLARGGMRRATAAGQVNARVWNVTFARTDGGRPMVEWVPAHLSRAQVGTAVIGDGSTLTLEQWEMNKLVDEHAKVAANQGRRPRGEIVQYLGMLRLVAARAAWIGRATYAANNGNEEPRRDSTPSRGPRDWQEAERKRRRTATGEGKERRQARPAELGGHVLQKGDRGWACLVCRKVSGDWNRVAGGCCRGSAARFWARRAQELGGCGGSDGAGHVRAAFGEVIWCIRCGAYAVKHAIGLAGPCRGAPMSASQTRVLKRLKDGRHPRTNVPFGVMMVREVEGVDGDLEETGGEGERGTGWLRGGRRAFGYLRRPGGARRQAAEELTGDGGAGLCVNALADDDESGPRSVFLKRQREMQLTDNDYRAGDEYEERRARAYAARHLDAVVAEALVEKFSGAIEASGNEGGREDEVSGRADEGLASGGVLGRGHFVAAEVGGEVRSGLCEVDGREADGWQTVRTRKVLMERLGEAVTQQAKRRKAVELGLDEEVGSKRPRGGDGLSEAELRVQGDGHAGGCLENEQCAVDTRKSLVDWLRRRNYEQHQRKEKRVVMLECDERSSEEEVGLARGKREIADGGRENVEVKRGKATFAEAGKERGRTAIASKDEEGEGDGEGGGEGGNRSGPTAKGQGGEVGVRSYRGGGFDSAASRVEEGKAFDGGAVVRRL